MVPTAAAVMILRAEAGCARRWPCVDPLLRGEPAFCGVRHLDYGSVQDAADDQSTCPAGLGTVVAHARFIAEGSRLMAACRAAME